MKVFRNICRIILGIVFIFSGFVKAVDPLGSKYKFEDYFLAFGMDWFVPAALIFGIILFTIEFFLGVAFLFNIKVKQLSWVMLLFMVFFLILTFVLAITNLVTDCGCFGDAIVMTNWETFWKNVVFMGPTLVVFFTRKRFVNKLHGLFQGLISLAALTFILGVAIYGLRHLPVIDFMGWKKGVDIKKQLIPTPEKAEIYLIYKHKVTGEEYEYTAQTLPYKDTAFFSQIEFVDQKKVVIEPYKEAPIHDFVIDDENRDSYNEDIIGNPSWQFMLVSYDLDLAKRPVFKEINVFADSCFASNISFVALTGSDWTRIKAFKQEVGAKFEFFVVDPTALKSVVRSNPGLVLLKDGVVADKWAWRDLPEWKDFLENQAEYEKLVETVHGNRDSI